MAPRVAASMLLSPSPGPAKARGSRDGPGGDRGARGWAARGCSATLALSLVLNALFTAHLAVTSFAPEPRVSGGGGAVRAREARFLVDPYPTPGPTSWDCLSPAMRVEYNLRGRIPVQRWTARETLAAPLSYSQSDMARYMALANARDPDVGTDLCVYGPICNKALFQALQEHPISGKEVLVIGTQKPWLEAVCLSHGAKLVTTVDFQPPRIEHPQVRVLSVTELDASDDTFDAIFSYSSLEHDGLGRYGDPLHPNGDLERMKKIRGLIRPGGLMFLGVPNGPDELYYNAHRIYGPIRFPLLIQGWRRLATYGHVLDALLSGDPSVLPACEKGRVNETCHAQPVHVLTPEPEPAPKGSLRGKSAMHAASHDVLAWLIRLTRST